MYTNYLAKVVRGPGGEIVGYDIKYITSSAHKPKGDFEILIGEYKKNPVCKYNPENYDYEIVEGPEKVSGLLSDQEQVHVNLFRRVDEAQSLQDLKDIIKDLLNELID